MNNEKIRLLATGGTIDAEGIDTRTEEYIFTKTHLPEMMKQARNKADIEIEVLMLKYSYHLDDSDREKILKKCLDCREDKIVITHGTGTMVETAQLLGRSIKDKTMVLTGAMVPYTQKNSDALFNLGYAIAAVQLLPKGVYIAMHGKIFTWDNVRKDKRRYCFEEIIPHWLDHGLKAVVCLVQR